jgi:hypothetical protein
MLDTPFDAAFGEDTYHRSLFEGLYGFPDSNNILQMLSRMDEDSPAT